ncbi:hypothetical protein [Acidocella sp.]|uniref:hypothetical protein n=1 Tax=Acidocella sp. TaxID=50710 RepID=UPI003D006095
MSMTAKHSPAPANIQGATMIPAGKFMVGYSYMNMNMSGNYLGDSRVSPEDIVTAISSSTRLSNGEQEKYRVVPTSMTAQIHMLKAMYGVTDRLNLMIMAKYIQKWMRMTTFAGKSGANVLGTSAAQTSGFGDTSIGALWRIHQDRHNHVHLNFGISLPTGSTTKTATMLSPSGKYMTMRASYGMQLGTGTYDLLPGITYTGQWAAWSWGAAYRGRFALGDNSHGYHYGALNELTGWGGYGWLPGITTSFEIDASTQGRIHGADPEINGLMQGTNPNFYGGKQVSLLGGVEISGARFGAKGTLLSIVAGGPVYQNLNGPQLGRAWQIGVNLGAMF